MREKKGLSQTEVGEAIGMSRQFVSEVERGVSSPRLDLLEKIATEVLHSSVFQVLGSVTIPDGYDSLEHRRLHAELQDLLDADGSEAESVGPIISALHKKMRAARAAARRVGKLRRA